LIVGEARVGKTSLMKQISSFSFDDKEISTEGIEINTWLYENNAIDFTVNIWDFGGQEIYHATHQFFLSKRSLYLLVWDSDIADEQIHYWINVINILSNHSPILLVLNKIDLKVRKIQQNYFERKYPNIVGFFQISAKLRLNVDKLISAIKEQIAKLPHIGEVIPKQWLEIRTELKSLERNHISISEYIDICRKYKLDREDAMVLSQYFHDIGVFLHFQYNHILSKIIFLCPSWVTDAVYKLTDTPQIRDNNGLFNLLDLQVFWGNYPEEKHIHLLELMRNFELCFELPNKKEFIIPELLSTEQPEFVWKEEENLKYQLRYDFIPPGIMTRFIVRNHDLIEESLFWKNGVILCAENSRALITYNVLERIIRVRICGTNKKDMLATIRRDFHYIDFTLNYPTHNESIGCICSSCITRDIPYFFDFKTLAIYQQRIPKKIECPISHKLISIDELIGNIEIIQDAKQSIYNIYNFEKGANHMEIKNLNITGGNINIADKIDKIVYNESTGISHEEFIKVLDHIMHLPTTEVERLKKHYYKIETDYSIEEKQSIGENVKQSLLTTGLSLVQNLAASAVFELVKPVLFQVN